jgi:thiamine pyrophosphate-dependent acetolactate synthase large subunit-like protein
LRRRTYFSTYQDNLAYGYGTALGAKAACPDRAVLSIAGDGCACHGWSMQLPPHAGRDLAF